MNIPEQIDVLKEIKDFMLDVLQEADASAESIETVKETMEAAETALSLQEPKPVVTTIYRFAPESGFEGCGVNTCPRCGMVLTHRHKPVVCDCGQRLEWNYGSI